MYLNPEDKKAYAKRYYESRKKDPEFRRKCSVIKANWLKNNPDKLEQRRNYQQRYGKLYRERNQERLKEESRIRTRKRKERILAHYGGSCACCGETRTEFLGIDHINGGGGKHRLELRPKTTFYQWIINTGFPTGFRVLCHNCNQSLGLYKYCPHQTIS